MLRRQQIDERVDVSEVDAAITIYVRFFRRTSGISLMAAAGFPSRRDECAHTSPPRSYRPVRPALRPFERASNPIRPAGREMNKKHRPAVRCKMLGIDPDDPARLSRVNVY